jgi:hypothetical protein
MKTSCPIANASPSKYTNSAVFNRRAEDTTQAPHHIVIPSCLS